MAELYDAGRRGNAGIRGTPEQERAQARGRRRAGSGRHGSLRSRNPTCAALGPAASSCSTPSCSPSASPAAAAWRASGSTSASSCATSTPRRSKRRSVRSRAPRRSMRKSTSASKPGATRLLIEGPAALDELAEMVPGRRPQIPAGAHQQGHQRTGRSRQPRGAPRASCSGRCAPCLKLLRDAARVPSASIPR